MVVNVKEREKVGTVCNPEKTYCLVFDLEGFIFQDISFPTSQIIGFLVESQKDYSLKDTVDFKEDIQKLKKITTSLENLDIKLTSFQIENPNLVIANVFFETDNLKDNFQIYFDFKENVILQLLKLKEVWIQKIKKRIENGEDLEYLELRFSNQVFVKFKK